MSDFEELNRTVEFRGHAYEVHIVKLRLPNGGTHNFELVEHNDSVSILPVDSQGNMLFVRQYRVGAKDDLLELPAGVLNKGEDPLAGADREVREETGMAAYKLVQLGQAYLAPGYSSELMYFFLATDLYPAPLQQDADEFLELLRIPVGEAYRMARSGELRDSKTLAALLLAENYLT